MTSNASALVVFINQHLEGNPHVRRRALDDRILTHVMNGVVKLPLDRVQTVAEILSCDERTLFQLALGQFYDEKSLTLFKRMFQQDLTEAELLWLEELRKATDGHVAAPGSTSRRLVRAMAQSDAQQLAPDLSTDP